MSLINSTVFPSCNLAFYHLAHAPLTSMARWLLLTVLTPPMLVYLCPTIFGTSSFPLGRLKEDLLPIWEGQSFIVVRVEEISDTVCLSLSIQSRIRPVSHYNQSKYIDCQLSLPLKSEIEQMYEPPLKTIESLEL